MARSSTRSCTTPGATRSSTTCARHTPTVFAGRTAGIRNMYDLSATRVSCTCSEPRHGACRTELGGSADRAEARRGCSPDKDRRAARLLPATRSAWGRRTIRTRAAVWSGIQKSRHQRILATAPDLDPRAPRNGRGLHGRLRRTSRDDDRQIYAYRRSSTGPARTPDAPRDEM